MDRELKEGVLVVYNKREYRVVKLHEDEVVLCHPDDFYKPTIITLTVGIGDVRVSLSQTHLLQDGLVKLPICCPNCGNDDWVLTGWGWDHWGWADVAKTYEELTEVWVASFSCKNACIESISLLYDSVQQFEYLGIYQVPDKNEES